MTTISEANPSLDDDALPLGEVVRRIRNVFELRASAGRQKLLDLLRTSKLVGFVFLSGEPQIEVPVPKHFWTRIDSARFASVLYQKGNKFRTGAFFLEFQEISGAIADVFHEETNKPGSPSLFANIARVIAAASENREVYIRQSVLNAWIKEAGHQLDEQYVPVTKKGRPPKNWYIVLESLARVLLTELERNGIARPRPDALAAEVHADAEKHRGTTEIPAAGTIKKEIITKLIGEGF